VDLAVEPVETDGGVLRVSPGHLEVRRSVPSGANPTTAVEIKIAFTAYQERHEIDPLATEPSYPDDATPWLQLSEGMIQVTPAVQALSAAIAGHGKRPGEILARIWAFIGEHIQLGAIHFSDLDPDDPLSSIVRIGWADCFTATALLVGLCRARGVPARMVRGALLYPMTPGGPHYWADVLLPPYGWVPVDTLGWTLAGGDPAATEWVNLFFGRLDYRMKIATLPARRVGLLGIRYPRLWYMVQTPCDGGTIVTTSDVESRQFAFRDRWKVSCGAITSTQSRPQRSSGP
jgi:transglutaminase-like putative cysteine protease